MEKTQEDILAYIGTVTKGILKEFKSDKLASFITTNPLSYANWKKQFIALKSKLIKSDKEKFFFDVNMWLDITQNQILGTNENESLDILKTQYTWINDLLEIKKIINNLDI